MKFVTNTSNKIINVGAIALLPGETNELPAEFENNAPVRCFERMGFLRIFDDGAEKAAAEAKTAKEAAEAAEKAAKEQAEKDAKEKAEAEEASRKQAAEAKAKAKAAAEAKAAQK